MTDKLTLASDKPHDQEQQQDPATLRDDQSEDRMRRALEQLGGGSAAARPHQPAGSGSRNSVPGHSALGHEAFAGSRKHRFVQDGDVQVTHVQGRRERGVRAASPAPSAALTPGAKNTARDALAEERGLRQRAERAAQDAQELIAALQTKLGHAEIALGEAREATQAHTEATAKLQAELQLHDEHIKSLQTRLTAAEADREMAQAQLAQAQQTSARQTSEAVEMPAAKAPVTKAAPVAASARKISRLTRSVAQIQKARDPNAEEPQPVKWWLGNKD